MPEMQELSGTQIGIWLACLWLAVGFYNSASEAWGRANGREKNSMPNPLHTQEVKAFATEEDVRRVELRVQHLEESQAAMLSQLTRDKSEIMEAAVRGRTHLNEQITQLAAVCNRTAGSVQELSAQIATLFNSALRKRE